jgi:hypothetical protein
VADGNADVVVSNVSESNKQVADAQPDTKPLQPKKQQVPAFDEASAKDDADLAVTELN